MSIDSAQASARPELADVARIPHRGLECRTAYPLGNRRPQSHIDASDTH
jgi:hypothetical protein